MYNKINKVIDALKNGGTETISRELASYMMNIYGKKDLYCKEKTCSETINVTPDLTVKLLFIEDHEICISNNIKYYYESKRDNLIFCVRKDFNSCTFKEKIMTITRITTTILSRILEKDDVGEMTKFYAQLIYSLLAFDNDKREEIVEIITGPFAEHSQELLDDFDYISNKICEMKNGYGVEAILHILFNCGGIFAISNEREKMKKEEEGTKND